MRALIIFAILTFWECDGATLYVRDGAAGSGTSWSDAYDELSSAETAASRGDTIYVADGTYASVTFNAVESGDVAITIKKATVADHGTETGWDNTYGDGQAVIGAQLYFETGDFVFDGNGSHTVPSNTSSDYGFKINNTSTTMAGVVKLGPNAGGVSNVTVRYCHIYSQYGPTDNPAVLSIRWPVSGAMTHTKIQNCFIENSGQDGLQINSSDFVLVERCYLKRLGRRDGGVPDNHGQTVQMFVGNTDVIFRWNIWEACEGQSLIAYGEGAYATARLRFYGNIVFTGYQQSNTAGFGLSGGIIGNAWTASPSSTHILIYNNSIVNQRTTYTTSAGTAADYPSDIAMTTSYIFNNIHFNSETSGASAFTGHGYHASGGYGTATGSNEQTGISSSIFTSYEADNFALAAGTAAGLALTGESWWDDSAHAFFGQNDYAVDMSGSARGSDGVWDRGAFEFQSTPPITGTRGIPLNIRLRP